MNSISKEFKRVNLSKWFQSLAVAALLLCFFCSSTVYTKEILNQKLIYLNAERLDLAKQMLEAENTLYTEAYDSIIALADEELKKEIDPVTNKTVIPASGDIHDYHTLGSYYWPDSSKEDGLPWIYKDGEFNPITKGPETDWTRLREMFSSLNTLNLAYYFSGNEKYILKARKIVQVWFIDAETKVNPNVDYGKAIPGKVTGTNFAVIDWTDIGKVITTIQLLEADGLWSERDKEVMDQWFNDYYRWLTESEFGIRESTRTNNHATNYDYQLIGIMIYLGKLDEAEAKIEEAKHTRIETQIDKDGSQPHELRRTKSVNYTVNNLWALARIADLGRRFTNVDLWDFQSENGAGLKKAFDFVIPYLKGGVTWNWKQITGGGAERQLENLALPVFSRSGLMLGEKILPDGLNGYDKFKPHEVLMYAPVNALKEKVNYFSNNAYGNPVIGNTAEYYKGVTYIAYQGDNLDPYVAAYNHENDQWLGPFKAGTNLLGQLLPDKIDSHGKPTLVIDGEGYIHLVFGGHGGTPDLGQNTLGNYHAGKQIHVKSKKPLDISEWEEVDNITPFGTYSQLFKMDNGDIYLIFRHGAHRSNWVYQVSKDNCRTFSPVVSFLKSKPVSLVGDYENDWDSWYPDFHKGRGNDIIMAYNYHFCKSSKKGHDGERHNGYFMRFDTDNKVWFNAKGETLQIPITKEYADTMTLVMNTGDRWNHIGHACLNDDDHPHVSWYEGEYDGSKHGGPKQLVNYQWTGKEWTGGKTNLPIEGRGEMLATSADSIYYLLGFAEEKLGEVAWWLSSDGGSDFLKKEVLVNEVGGKFLCSHFIRNAHPDARIVVSQKVEGTDYSRIYLLGDKGPVERQKVEAEILKFD